MIFEGFNLGARLGLCVVILGNAIGSPSLRHAHPDGEVPHSHSVSHDHHGDDEETCCDHDHFAAHETSPGAQQVHEHFSWLGFHFCLPCQQQSQNSDPNSRAHQITAAYVAPLLSVGKITSLSIQGWSSSLHWATPQAICNCANSPCIRLVFLKTAQHKSLCDIARHERSGVQLA